MTLYVTTHNIFDKTFNGMGGSEVYRAWVIPELYPNHEQAPQPTFRHWPQEEIDIYCNGLGDSTISKGA